MRSRTPKLLFLTLVATLAACGYRPVRFADRPPVTRVADDKPVKMPDKSTFINELYKADVYVRRELVNGLDPRRVPHALDVNAIDEVPRSSWFQRPRDEHAPLRDYRRDGPPRPPIRFLDDPASSGTPEAVVISDARGLRYELQPDLKDRPKMRTAAAVIASRLLHAIGYRTPEVYILTLNTGERMAATRWPNGEDLGPTPIVSTRGDDPNDAIDHLDRRTLRALHVVCGWLAIKRLRPRMLRDVYVGSSPKGYVEHQLVGLDGALGVDDYIDAVKWANDPDRQDSNFFLRVFSMGLSPKAPSIMPQTRWPSVGLITERLLPAEHDTSPPFEPFDRMSASDVYWATKRIAAIPHASIARAIMAARIKAKPQNWLLQVLHMRRAAVIAYGYDRVTPLEVVTIKPPAREQPAFVELADLAITAGVMKASKTSYQVRYLASDGDELGSIALPARGAVLSVPLPVKLRAHDYVVVQVTGKRSKTRLPRAFEVHLKPSGKTFRLLGVRH